MRPLYVFALLAVCSACASSAARSANEGSSSSTVRRSRNVLSRAELNEVEIAEMNVLQAVRRFRPHFLSSGGASSMSGPGSQLLVYLGEVRLGNASSMEQIRMSEVEAVEYLSGSEATLRFGTGHAGGAIVIRRRN